MENILQSIVKVIIIGAVLKTSNVEGNRQFLSLPLPYYQNEGYYLPGFVPPYQEHIPIYYREPNAPPPISYQNSNSYNPPQLFQQNDNYNPAQFANPNLRYSVPQIFQFKPNHYQPYIPEAKINIKTPEVPTASAESPHKKPYYDTNIIVKEEHPPPYYHDDYTKNYQEDDYSDNYSDDSSSQSEPCLPSPYRYFESPKSNNPNLDRYTLCNPYFQPNFGNSVYTVKMPITLLPSRFPPRVEELIERIQNYFSTYTEKETPKPQNETQSTTTIQPVTEGTSENDANTTLPVTEVYKKNLTAEIVELSLVKNSQPIEVTTVTETTEQTMTVEIKEEEMTSTVVPDAHVEEESQMVLQSTQNTKEVTENVSTESSVKLQKTSEQNFQTPTAQVLPMEENGVDENESGNQILSERDYSDKKTEIFQEEKTFTDTTNQSTTADMTEVTTRIEETSSVQPMNDTIFEIADKNG